MAAGGRSFRTVVYLKATLSPIAETLQESSLFIALSDSICLCFGLGGGCFKILEISSEITVWIYLSSYFTGCGFSLKSTCVFAKSVVPQLIVGIGSRPKVARRKVAAARVQVLPDDLHTCRFNSCLTYRGRISVAGTIQQIAIDRNSGWK